LLSLLVALQRMKQAPDGRPLYLASVATLSLTLLSHSYDFGAVLRQDGFGGAASTLFVATPASTARYEDLQKVARQVPPKASVVATSFMLPYVSNRPDVFDASRPFGEPDYIFISSLELVGTARSLLSAAFEMKPYALVASRGEFYLFRRGSETPKTGAALAALGLASGKTGPHPGESFGLHR